MKVEDHLELEHHFEEIMKKKTVANIFLHQMFGGEADIKH